MLLYIGRKFRNNWQICVSACFQFGGFYENSSLDSVPFYVLNEFIDSLYFETVI